MEFIRSFPAVFGVLSLLTFATSAGAQVPPQPAEAKGYSGLHRAAYDDDVDAIQRLARAGANVEIKDSHGRTPLHIAAFQSRDEAVRALADAGADANALEYQAYDIVTIAAVAGDVEMVRLALSVGCNSGNVTSPYDGTALIAAAHLGHAEVVRTLVEAGAPLDHVNNLGWTALIEAVILGDGGPRHIETVKILLGGGADPSIADRAGMTPLRHAIDRGYGEIARLIRNAEH